MQKWNDLADRMWATGKYYEPRLKGRLLARQYHRGSAVARFDESLQPWRVTAFVGCWLTPSSEWVEAGTLYVENAGNGTGQEILAELIAKKPQGRRLFLISNDIAALRAAINCRFHIITRSVADQFGLPSDLQGMHDWAWSVGLRTPTEDRLPYNALLQEIPNVRKAGRQLLVL